MRKALSFAFLDRYASLAIAVGSSMILARLLTPADIGLWSVTMMLLAYASTVRDFGAGQYLVQAKELTTERIRSVWAVQLGTGMALALLVYLAGRPLANFYGDERMYGLMTVVSLTYALNPFGSITYAWLMREMRFEKIAVIRFSASVAGAALSIVLALGGHGPMSLAYGSLASTAVTCSLSVMLRPAHLPWLPGFGDIRSVVSFGSSTTLSLMIHGAAASAPELLLGKLQSLVAVGFYSRAYGLVGMFSRLLTDALGGVALSWFARHRRESVPIAEPFLKATSYVCALGWSFFVVLALLAHPVVRVLYGDQWDEAVDLVRILAVAGAFNAPAVLCWSALISAGAAAQVLRATLLCAVQSVALVAFGAWYGVVELGFAMVAAAAIDAAVWLNITRPVARFAWTAFAAMALRSIAVAAGAAVAPVTVFVVYGARPEAWFAPLAWGLTGSAAGFVLAVHAVRHPLREELRRFNGGRDGTAGPGGSP